MQADDVKPSSKLKTATKVFWWALATVAAVPITKWGESQLNLSFFSPWISGLWNQIVSVGDWLDQSAPISLWALLGITVLALLMAGCFLWIVLDANKQLNAANAELHGAHRKIAELSNPHLVSLNKDQQTVLSAIALDEESDGTYVSALPQLTGLHRLVGEGALDVLLDNRLVEIYPGGYGARVGLASAGRQYILHPKSPIQWLVNSETQRAM
jgi:hypothetical protein